MPFIIF